MRWSVAKALSSSGFCASSGLLASRMCVFLRSVKAGFSCRRSSLPPLCVSAFQDPPANFLPALPAQNSLLWHLLLLLPQNSPLVLTGTTLSTHQSYLMCSHLSRTSFSPVSAYFKYLGMIFKDSLNIWLQMMLWTLFLTISLHAHCALAQLCCSICFAVF